MSACHLGVPGHPFQLVRTSAQCWDRRHRAVGQFLCFQRGLVSAPWGLPLLLPTVPRAEGRGTMGRGGGHESDGLCR